jgi:hypothetical protein
MTLAYRKEMYAFPQRLEGNDPRIFKCKSFRGLTYILKYKENWRRYSKSVPKGKIKSLLDECLL